MINITRKDDIDAFFLCHNNAKATLEVVKKFFEIYPNGNIYLYCDNGKFNYQSLTESYPNIYYKHNNFTINPFAMPVKRAMSWASIFHHTCSLSKRKYLMHLEDDVWVNRRVKARSKHNMLSAKCFSYAVFRSKAYQNIIRYPSLENMSQHYGGPGGTIFEREIISKQKLFNIYNMIKHFCQARRLWSDQLLTLMIYLGQGTLGYHKYLGREPDRDVSHSHDNKIYYGEPLTREDRRLVFCKKYNEIFKKTFPEEGL